jgi:exosortase
MSDCSPLLKEGVPVSRMAIIAGLGACLLWAHWPTLLALENRWATDPQLSHGFMVPLFAAIVLWSRRSSFPARPWSINPWGVAFLGAASVIRLASAYIHFGWLDGCSPLVSLAGVCVLVGSWKLLRWASPGLVMLFFMLPLPYQIEIALAATLQRLATQAATYTLQTLGYAAVSEGNVIVLDDMRIGVAEACSGLGMLATFFALSTAVAFVMPPPRYEKVIVFLSAIPIGLLVNLIRIAVTAWAYKAFGPRIANALFHGYAGWLMMPLALLTLWLELLLLKRLLVAGAAIGPVPVVVPRSGAQPSLPAAVDRSGLRTRLLAQPAAVADDPSQIGR